MSQGVVSCIVGLFLMVVLHGSLSNAQEDLSYRRSTPCPPVCAIYCPNGNVPDRFGCPTCRCIECKPGYQVMNPRQKCRRHVLGSRQCGWRGECQSRYGGVSGVCCTRRLPQPGQCPRVRPDVICPAVVRPGDCVSDRECGRGRRCCRVGCSRECIPVITNYRPTRG